jgi:hypothetical protein
MREELEPATAAWSWRVRPWKEYLRTSVALGMGVVLVSIAWDAGFVEAEHSGVGVDEGPMIHPEEDVVVPDIGAGGELARKWQEGAQAAEDGWVIAAEVVSGAQVAVEGRVDVELLEAWERVEKRIVVVVQVVAAAVE